MKTKDDLINDIRANFTTRLLGDVGEGYEERASTILYKYIGEPNGYVEDELKKLSLVKLTKLATELRENK